MHRDRLHRNINLTVAERALGPKLEAAEVEVSWATPPQKDYPWLAPTKVQQKLDLQCRLSKGLLSPKVNDCRSQHPQLFHPRELSEFTYTNTSAPLSSSHPEPQRASQFIYWHNCFFSKPSTPLFLWMCVCVSLCLHKNTTLCIHTVHKNNVAMFFHIWHCADTAALLGLLNKFI